MTAYDPGAWADFALAQLGASAALLGLVFVGLSINLKDLIGSRLLVNRAGEAVIGLGGVLAASTCVLVPEQSRTALGIELLVVAVVIFASIAYLQRGAWASIVPKGERGATRGSVRLRQVLGLGSALLVMVTGVTLLAEAGGGLYWWPAAILAAYTGALTNAWVLMVEILR